MAFAQAAVDACGSRAELAERMTRARPRRLGEPRHAYHVGTISKWVLGTIPVSLESALVAEKATDGKVIAAALHDDLLDKEARAA